MKQKNKKHVFLVAICATTMLLTSCSSVPVTGRKQMLLVSNEEVLNLSLQQYSDFIKTAPISTDKKNTAMVEKVGTNIALAVEKYFKENGMESQLSEFAWEFKLVKSDEVNAFCMPGGKIVVYEGILPITKNESGLAAVVGHEVAHAVAKHANERMSQQMATEYGGAALGSLLGNTSSGVQQAAATVFGLGTQYGVLLPYSRKQELEADKLGMIFMAMAGYNPNEALDFWSRMAQAGSSVPEFTSTHPSDATRIQKIQEALPEALKYYGNGKTTPAKTSSQWKF